MAEIRIDVSGVDKISELITRFPGHLQEALEAAGKETASEILETEGIRKYPPVQLPRPAMPMTEKQRRWFFYALKNNLIDVPYNRGGTNSQKFGSQWYVEQSHYTTTIGNRSGYGGYLVGENQAQYMASLGWRKLTDVAADKTNKIKTIYEGWLNRAVEKSGLK